MKPEIKELQKEAAEALFIAMQSKKEVSLKAPTGSGKTHIMAMLMEKILKENENAKFLVSSLSRANLARQNYEKFQDLEKEFSNLKPFYISSGNENAKNKDYSLFIDTGCNVFCLATAQFTKSSRIYKEGALLKFLEYLRENKNEIYLLRDESHIQTNNLRELESKGYFSKIINFSATPKSYDVLLSEESAIEARLIKSVSYDTESKELNLGLNEALTEFKKARKIYMDKNNGTFVIRPAFIVQISNKELGEDEIKKITEIVEKHGLTWVCFVEKENGYTTNTRLKFAKKALWQNEIKENTSFIDVVIFKMVITEGFDIRRACMLYQVRKTESEQLDEQVIGRIRRNPFLRDFENLPQALQDEVVKARVWGVKPKAQKKIKVKLKGEIHGGSENGLFENELIKEFHPFKILTLKQVKPETIDISTCFKNDIKFFNTSIFECYDLLENADEITKQKYKEFVNKSEDFFTFMENFDHIKEKVLSVVEDYEKNSEIKEVELRSDIYSFFEKSGEFIKLKNDNSADNDDNLFKKNQVENQVIKDWIWDIEKENEEKDFNKFCFDSKAEKEWCEILERLAKKYCKTLTINGRTVYLFGKNFITNSNIKFEYFHLKIRTSYPDFIFKDKNDRVHIFEVKSTNKSANSLITNEKKYNEKILKLQAAYKCASKKLEYIFYVPIKTQDEWLIHKYKAGEEEKIYNKQSFMTWFEGEFEKFKELKKKGFEKI